LGWLIAARGCSLSVGRAMSLLSAKRLRVSSSPLLIQESRTFRTKFVFLKNLLEKSLNFNKKEVDFLHFSLHNNTPVNSLKDFV
jgi:hypothetical protein